MRIARGILMVAVAGCSSSSATAPDAAQPSVGQFVLSRLTILDPGDLHAFDLTGDGVPDNALGILAADYSNLFDLAILSGEIILVEASDLPTPPINGPMTIAIYSGQDEDLPANPGDNFTGSEHFYIHPASLDANGRPIITGSGQIAN